MGDGSAQVPYNEMAERRRFAEEQKNSNIAGYGPPNKGLMQQAAATRSACEPRPPRPIENAMQDLEMTTTQLEQLVETVEGRLHAVLENNNPEAKDQTSMPPRGPGLAPAIGEQSRRVARVCGRLQSLLNRLEL